MSPAAVLVAEARSTLLFLLLALLLMMLVLALHFAVMY
jgi:hypothetical protein